MSKGIKKVAKLVIHSLLGVVLILILLFLAVALSFSLPRVQSLAAGALVDYLSDKVGVEASIGAVSITGLTRIEVDELFIEDMERDTLLYADRLSATIDRNALFVERQLRPRDVKLTGASIRLLEDEQDSNLNRLIDHVRSFLPTPSTEKRSAFVVEGIEITDSRFRLFNARTYEPITSGVNYADMDVLIDCVRSRSLSVEGGVVELDIYNAKFADKSGAKLDDGRIGLMHIGIDDLTFDDVCLRTEGSYIDMPRLAFTFEDWSDWSDFNNSVDMRMRLNPSLLTPAGFMAYVPDFVDIGVILRRVSGEYNGVLNDFWVDVEAEFAESSSVDLCGSVAGITELDSVMFELDRAIISTTRQDGLATYEQIAREPLSAELAQWVGKLDTVEVNLSGEGNMKRQDLELSLLTNKGSVEADGVLTQLSNKSFGFDGGVGVEEVALGELLDVSNLGSLSGSAEGNLIVGRDYFDFANALVVVDKIGFNGYDYHDISIEGEYVSDIFKGSLRSLDSNMRLLLEGECDLSWFVPSYSFDLSVERADFAAVGLSGKSPMSVLTCTVDAAGEGGHLDELAGRITINDLSYYTKADTLSTELVNIVATNGDDGYALSLYSMMANMEYRSKASYSDVIDYVSKNLVAKLPLIKGVNAPTPILYEAADEEERFARADDLSTLLLSIKSDDHLLSAFLPGVSVAPDSSLRMEFSPSADYFELRLDCDYLEMNDLFASALVLDGFASGNRIEISGESEQLLAYGMSFPGAEVVAECSNAEDVEASISFDNTVDEVSARLAIAGALRRDEGGDVEAEVSIQPDDNAFLSFGGQMWDVEAKRIAYSKEQIVIDSLDIASGVHYLFADGAIGDSDAQTLSLALSDVPLDNIVAVTAGIEGLKGRANGHFMLQSALSQPSGNGRIALTDLNFNGVDVDPLSLDVAKAQSSDVVKLALENRDTATRLAEVSYDMVQQNYDVDVTINEIELSLFDALLDDYIDDIDGVAAVGLTVGGGKNRKLDIDGRIGIENLATTIGYTGVSYEFEPVELMFMNNRGVLSPVQLRDKRGHEALLDGFMDMSGNDLNYGLNLISNNLMVLDLSADAPTPFYGSVFASGVVSLASLGNSTDITAVLSTDAGSVFNLPLQGNNEFSGADFVQFVTAQQEEENSAQAIVADKMRQFEGRAAQMAIPQNTNIDAQLKVGTNTELRLIVDQATDNVLVARGEADMNITLDSRREGIEFRGDYQIAEGVYNFNFQNIIAKQFDINQGSYIRWNGSPLDASLDVSATYKLKTSLAPLLGNDVSSARGSTPVECIVNMGGNLSAIDLSFDINVPTANAEYQSILSSYFSSQEMMATQFVYLLAIGSFYSDESTSSLGTSPTTAGTSIGLDFLANQVSKLISNDSYKFKFKYNALDDATSSYGVDFQTGFLDDRLLLELDANVDRGTYYQSSVNDQSQLSGGFTLTWVIDKFGNLLAKIFSRTIDRFDENQGLQEWGGGLYYRKSFDKFGELWRKKEALNESGSEKTTTFAVPQTPATDVVDAQE